MAHLGWNGNCGELSDSYSDTYSQTGMDAAGGIIISSEGMTLAQPLDMNNGVALVAAPVPPACW